MKNSLIILLSLATIISCNSVSEKQTDKTVLYDTVPKYDLQTGEVIGDTIIPIVTTELAEPPAIPDSIPIYEEKKLIGWISRSQGKFIAKEGVKPLHSPEYYESELGEKK